MPNGKPNILVIWGVAGQFVETFKEFPPVQKPGSFTIGDAVSKLASAGASH